MSKVDTVCDPTDTNVVYWVAWSAEDNLNADPWSRTTLIHRVFRDDRRERHATPISAPMSRDEAYKLLEHMELLFKGS